MEVLVLFLRPKKVVPIQRASGQTLKGHEFALLSGIKYHVSLLSPFPSQVSMSPYMGEGGGEGPVGEGEE